VATLSVGLRGRGKNHPARRFQADESSSMGILSWHEGARMLIDYRSLVGFK
jgi:hypothetical protein